MNVERFGWFNADSEYASFLAAYDFDPGSYPHFNDLFKVLEKLILAEAGGSYLIYADASTMAQDEDEYDKGNHDYYSIDGDELQAGPATTLPTDELEAFTLLARELFKEAAYEEISEDELASVVEEFKKLTADTDERRAANSTLSRGELVHVADPAGMAYTDAEPCPFDPAHHDGRKVLRDSEVDYGRGRGALTVHPLPPHPTMKSGKFWGEFQDKSLSRAYFMANTQKALEAKAAVHLAWHDKFGSNA